RLVFGTLQDRVPARVRPSFVHVRRMLERRAYGRVDRFLRNAQGVYSDGWAAPRAHFLCRRPPGASRLLVRGALPALAGQRAPARLDARVNGLDLGGRDVPAGSEFETAWPLPGAASAPDVVEVDL